MALQAPVRHLKSKSCFPLLRIQSQEETAVRKALWHSRFKPAGTEMFKRKAVTSGECSALPQRKKCCLVFKEEWMKEIVEAETQTPRSKVRMQLGELFQHSPDVGLICKACAEAKIVGDFSTGKKWSDGWKLDYMKRHLLSKVHESAMVILRNRSAAARFGFGVRPMLTETATDKANRMEVVERQRSMPEEIKILINNVLLAVKMNTSMLSVQDIHDRLALYVKIPDSWRSKNYAFEFLEAINSVIHCEAMRELRQALHHTLIIDESTDISVTKMLILYFKFRPPLEPASISKQPTWILMPEWKLARKSKQKLKQVKEARMTQKSGPLART
ncbi:uncharacterized protein LOC144792009 [Lissotriton helveticus]